MQVLKDGEISRFRLRKLADREVLLTLYAGQKIAHTKEITQGNADIGYKYFSCTSQEMDRQALQNSRQSGMKVAKNVTSAISGSLWSFT